MLKLPQVTLVCMTGLGYKIPEHVEAINKSCEQIEFGEVKYVQLPQITDIDTWNKAVIYDLPKYIFTTHCLLIHADGWVVNTESWQNQWLEYDYIGAPWPLPVDDYSYRDEIGNLQRVGNSVSLRSKKLLDLIATRDENWFWEQKRRYGNCNEDGFICCHNRAWLEEQGCKFAPLEVARYFSKEHEMEENKNIKTFAFHQV